MKKKIQLKNRGSVQNHCENTKRQQEEQHLETKTNKNPKKFCELTDTQPLKR